MAALRPVRQASPGISPFCSSQPCGRLTHALDDNATVVTMLPIAPSALRSHGDPIRQLVRASIAIAVLLVLGTFGYVLVEGWPFFDALYMTVTTITTVGFSEVHPLSTAGRAFTMVLIILGMGILFYVLGNVARVLLEGELHEVVYRYRREKQMKHIRDHYIVCGYGRMGRQVCKELTFKGLPFVVIEKDPQRLAQPPELTVEGDASQETVLQQARIERAKALVSVVGNDADNIYIVLTARGLNEGLFIVARAGDEGSEEKLLRAGATRVFSPYLIGASQVAQALIRPTVLEFLELATSSDHLDLQMEELELPKGNAWAGKSVHSLIGSETSVILVAVKRQSGPMKFNPDQHLQLAEGDKLIVLGQADGLRRLESLVNGTT